LYFQVLTFNFQEGTICIELFLIKDAMDNQCIFCDRRNFEDRLIYEDEDFYVIATLGQITDGGYVLLVPKDHQSCMGALMSQQAELALDLGFRICQALIIEYQRGAPGGPCPVTIFEHGIVGQTVKHAHLHFLPVQIDLTEKVRNDFPASQMMELQYAGHLYDLYRECPEQYLSWTVPGKKSMICWNPPAPPQYLRIAAAQLLGRPERANWRHMDPQLDAKLWSETVLRLRRYFP
jgi:diadenosine tetraphosphate (Ap4A) HIT family hydrolase